MSRNNLAGQANYSSPRQNNYGCRNHHYIFGCTITWSRTKILMNGDTTTCLPPSHQGMLIPYSRGIIEPTFIRVKKIHPQKKTGPRPRTFFLMDTGKLIEWAQLKSTQIGFVDKQLTGVEPQIHICCAICRYSALAQ